MRRADDASLQAGDEILRRVIACGREAARQRRPFWTFVTHDGIDSWLAEGLLGTPEGAIERFSYDSDPCGGGGCKSTFETAPCPRPALGTDPRHGPTFTCAS
jgi:hypothetical protein